jgi:hypothetical protein
MRFRILKFKPGTGRAPSTDSSQTPPRAEAQRPVSQRPLSQRQMQRPPLRETTLRALDVKPGDSLPTCAVPITATLIVAGAIASRDYQDVHHDRELAKLRGSPDIFMNILTTSGLTARYVTDWTGPEVLLRRLAIRLGAPNDPGDEMLLTGSVSAVSGGDLEIALRGENRLGPHVTGTVSLTLPA